MLVCNHNILFVEMHFAHCLCLVCRTIPTRRSYEENSNNTDRLKAYDLLQTMRYDVVHYLFIMYSMIDVLSRGSLEDMRSLSSSERNTSNWLSKRRTGRKSMGKELS